MRGGGGDGRASFQSESQPYDIVSVENVKGRGMYIEVLAKRSEPTIGKS